MQMKRITSRTNPTVLWAASLSEKKYREEHRAFLLEGSKLVLEAITERLPVSALFFAEGKIDAVMESVRAAGLEDVLSSYELYLLSDHVFEKISTEKAPQGVIAVVKYLDFFERCITIIPEKVAGRALFLCSVRDPGNLGAIIRSAVAFGTETLILSDDCADLYNPRTLRAAMGSLFKVRAVSVSNVESSVKALQKSDRRVLAAELREHALPLTELHVRPDDIFMIGNEGHGIPSAVSAACDAAVYIPIRQNVESLNASVAASVLLWEQMRSFDRR